MTRKEILHEKEREEGMEVGGEEKVLLEAGQVSTVVYTHTHTHTYTNIYHIQYIHKKHHFNVNDNIIT